MGAAEEAERRREKKMNTMQEDIVLKVESVGLFWMFLFNHVCVDSNNCQGACEWSHQWSGKKGERCDDRMQEWGLGLKLM